MVGRTVSTALALAGLAGFLLLVGAPVSIVALLFVCTSAVAAVLLEALQQDDDLHDESGERDAPPVPPRHDRTRAPYVERAPPVSMSTILNPHPANRRRRASREERSAVVHQLALHYADERLDGPEFDTRHEYAVKAVTRGDLADLLGDLPRPANRSWR